MDEPQAARVAASWRGGDGLVSRGPRWLLGFCPSDGAEVRRRTRRRVRSGTDVWRVQVGGRFLQAGGLVYPGGVPYPAELAGTVAAVTSEVWLYFDPDRGSVLGCYWWPEAVRRPIAARPEPDFVLDDLVAPQEAGRRVDLPDHPGWTTLGVWTRDPCEAVVLCVAGIVPEPLNEMMLLDVGGLTLRIRDEDGSPVSDILDSHSPPFRSVPLRGTPAAGREPGRRHGPQTWPWPGEVVWARGRRRYALRGFQTLATLTEVAATVGY